MASLLLLLENYLPAVALGGRRGGGALVNWRGGLVDWRGAPLLRAQGAAVGAALVVLVVRHGGYRPGGSVVLPQHWITEIRSIL